MPKIRGKVFGLKLKSPNKNDLRMKELKNAQRKDKFEYKTKKLATKGKFKQATEEVRTTGLGAITAEADKHRESEKTERDKAKYRADTIQSFINKWNGAIAMQGSTSANGTTGNTSVTDPKTWFDDI